MRNNRKSGKDEAAPLDPIAVTLALWLGLVVSVTGLVRLSANAASAAQEQQRLGSPVATRTIAMQFAPYGS